MMRALTAAILLLLPTRQDDKTAEELYKALCGRIDRAKSVRVEFTVTITEGHRTFARVEGNAKVKGSDRWMLDLKMPEYAEEPDRKYALLVVCDGKKVKATGEFPGLSNSCFTQFDPAESATEVRRTIRTSLVTAYLLMEDEYPQERNRPRSEPMLSGFKDRGKETVEGKETQVIEYQLQYTWGRMRRDPIGVKMYLDSATKLPLKRTFSAQKGTWTETFHAFAFDEEIPDSDLAWVTKRGLARSQAVQLARSVELYGMFTGGHPKTMEDLVKKPAHLESDIFWPDGGFFLGGVLPKDPWGRPFELKNENGRVSIVSWGADGKPGGKGADEDQIVEIPPVTHRAVGAPTEPLRKQFTARVQLHLLAAAVKAYSETYGELPRRKAALWEKPGETDIWPDGGWLPGRAVPNDPWGDPYRIISDKTYVIVQVKDPKSRLLTAGQLTSEEKAKLEETARPRYTAEEKKRLDQLIEKLGEDDLDSREQAEAELRAWGPAVGALLQERVKDDLDAEVLVRLRKLLAAIPPRTPAWMSELRSLRITVGEGTQDDTDKLCMNHLQQLWMMEMNYMVQFGGAAKRMPTAAGRDFWLALARTTPPLVDATSYDLFICPTIGMARRGGVCTYWGPAEDVNGMADGDPVGMCDSYGHGSMVIILRKSGDVGMYSRDDPLYLAAQKKLKR